MSPDDIRAWLTFAFVAIGVGLSLLAAWHAYQGRQAAEKARAGLLEVDGKIYQLDRRVDGRLTDLLASVRREAEARVDVARAEGHAAGEQAQRDRNADAQS